MGGNFTNYIIQVIPFTLAENAGLDPISTVTELRSRHKAGETTAGINVRKVSTIYYRHTLVRHITVADSLTILMCRMMTDYARTRFENLTNLLQSQITNILDENVVQPLLVSTSAITLAAETVRSLMKIDDIIQTR